MGNRPKSKLWIPTGLASLVLREHLTKPFHLYLYLKYHTGSIVKFDSVLLTFLVSYYKVSPNTIRNRLSKLIALDWVGHDELTGVLYIRSYNALCSKAVVNPRRSAPWQFSSSEDLKAFLGAVLFTTALKINKLRYRNQAVPKISSTIQLDRTSAFLFSTAAIESVAKFNQISKSDCQRLRRIAIKVGYLVARPQIDPLVIDKRELKTYDKELAAKYIIQKGKACKCLPDKLKSSISIKRTIESRNSFYSPTK